MSTDMKPCRHCRQPIAIDARLCQHCHGYQSWIANHRDPRYWIVWPILVFAALAAFLFLMRSTFEPGEDHGQPPRLTVPDTTTRVVPAADICSWSRPEYVSPRRRDDLVSSEPI